MIKTDINELFKPRNDFPHLINLMPCFIGETPVPEDDIPIKLLSILLGR